MTAWRESPYFTEAARHDEQPALAQLVRPLATVNPWNRLDVTTRRVAGSGW